MLRYRNLSIINSMEFKMIRRLTDGSLTSCLIDGLRPFTRYEFFLTPFHQNMERQPSNSKIVLTQEDGKLAP